MSVLCDHMLGSLATWLRIFGVDTLYPTNELSDDEILKIAEKEHRLLISRDKELLVRGKKLKIPVLEIHTTNLDEQITLVLQHLSIDASQVLTRCTLCNTVLVPVKKQDVRPYVPPKVFETKNEFWLCPVCQNYYWQGTHYDNMMEKIKELQKKASA